MEEAFLAPAETALKDSHQVSLFIAEHQATRFETTGERRLDVAVALFAIALEHRAGLLLLAESGAWTSAFALQRPLWEAYMRGCHAVDYLTEKRYAFMVAIKAVPKMETVVRELKKLGKPYEAYGPLKETLWEPFSDYSHGGIRQLSHWLGRDTIEPEYSDVKIVQCIRLADVFGLYASMRICEVAGQSLESYRPMMERLHAKGLKIRTGE